MASESSEFEPRESGSGSRLRRFIADGKGIYFSATILSASIMFSGTAVATYFNLKSWVSKEIQETQDFTKSGLSNLEKAIERLVIVNESMAEDMGEVKDAIKVSTAKRDEIYMKVVAIETWRTEVERRLARLEAK